MTTENAARSLWPSMDVVHETCTPAVHIPEEIAQSLRTSASHYSATPRSNASTGREIDASIAQYPQYERSQDRVNPGTDVRSTEIPFTINLPSEDEEAIGSSCIDTGVHLKGASCINTGSFQVNAKPKDVRRLLGVPEFQPRDRQPIYIGQRNYNYEEKYPADEPGEENGPDARFFKVYLDEAEIFDQEKLRGHRDNLDALLVFAALFSAIVTTFVVQTSQALRPDQGLITNYLLMQQTEIIKALGNVTAISAIASSQYSPDTPTHAVSDVWVNGLFFTSLSLSISTALLSVLAKQWLQAYDSSTSGSARDRALIRQLRFMGSKKWKLDEIIGALPLVLHASVGIFFIGLTVFLWAIHPVISWVIITISAISFTLYLASVVLPAIDIGCPYRITLLYRPMRYVVLSLSSCYREVSLLAKVPRTLFLTQLRIPRYMEEIQYKLSSTLNCAMALVKRIAYCISYYIRQLTPQGRHPLSLRDAERCTVRDSDSSRLYLHHGISWLHDMSSNAAVQRISAQAAAGSLCTSSWLNQPPRSLLAICRPTLVRTATEGLFDGDDLPSSDLKPGLNPSPWARAVLNIWMTSPSQVILEDLSVTLLRAAGMGRLNHVDFMLRCGADVNVQLDGATPLSVASYNGHLEVVRLLLRNSADVNLKSWRYGLGLQAASAEGHRDVVELLLVHGAKADLADGSYGPVLHAASATGHRDIVRLLLHYGADVNLEGGKYGSAIQAASVRGDLEICDMLLRHGADVNLLGGRYGSALQAASAMGHGDVFQLLLYNGATLSLEDRRYKQALDAVFRRPTPGTGPRAVPQ